MHRHHAHRPSRALLGRSAVALTATGVALLGAAAPAGAATARAAADTASFHVATTTPRFAHPFAVAGKVPGWAKVVKVQIRTHGTRSWRTIDQLTPSHGAVKDTVEVLVSSDLRAEVGAVAKHTTIDTKAVTVTPAIAVLYTGTLTGLATTPGIPTGDAAIVSYTFSCPAGTPAHGFGLLTLTGGEASLALDDDADGTSGGTIGALVPTDSGQLFGLEAIGATGCTWTVEIDG